MVRLEQGHGVPRGGGGGFFGSCLQSDLARLGVLFSVPSGRFDSGRIAGG